MRQTHLKILVGIIILLWTIYIVQTFFIGDNKEPFINSMYRPYIRTATQTYENFINNYGPNVVITKLRKWKIY